MNPRLFIESRSRKLFLLSLLLAGLGLLLASRVTAQTFTTLYHFAAGIGSSPHVTNSDGAYPVGRLVLSDNTLYGVTDTGGEWGQGTVYKINISGTGFTTLHTFTSVDQATYFTNSDGTHPFCDLLLTNNTLYGTAQGGGNSGNGAVFALHNDGTDFTNLYNFTELGGFVATTNSDGASPQAGLVLSDNILYGTASGGGEWGGGTIFKVNADGTDFTNLHSFKAFSNFTNTDGASPIGKMIISSNILYGTTRAGGNTTFPGNGTVFALNTDGTDFRVLHSFSPLSAGTNSDGAESYSLILSGNTLYGAAAIGGSSGSGTVFALNTDGTGFRVLHSFTPLSVPYTGTNNEGAGPISLILSGNTLYGVTGVGGFNSGTVFSINTDGTGFTVIHRFTPIPVPYSGTNSGGAYPAGLILSSNTFYGVANGGGASGNGTVFSLTLPPPQLAIIRSAANVVLTWPTSATGFTLQSAPTSTGTFTNISDAISPYTNAITGSQRYFRLISN